MSKKQITVLCICTVLGLVLCLTAAFFLLTDQKAPDAYTWDEYLNMSDEEQEELFQRFDSLEDFEAWKESVQPQVTEPDFQWNEPGKLPTEYSWEEYSSLTEEKKEAFFQWFESKDAFEIWMNGVKPEKTAPTNPVWEGEGKMPNEYTWAEYQALSPEEQDAFYLWFSSKDAFENWMTAAKPVQTEPPWTFQGKTPKEYTWEEYQSLSLEDQDAFYLWFDSMDAFEAWMEAAKPAETDPATGWDKPGKNPDEYTFDEYQTLTPEEQDLFYQWFSSRDAFEAWLDQAMKE